MSSVIAVVAFGRHLRRMDASVLLFYLWAYRNQTWCFRRWLVGGVGVSRAGVEFVPVDAGAGLGFVAGGVVRGWRLGMVWCGVGDEA